MAPDRPPDPDMSARTARSGKGSVRRCPPSGHQRTHPRLASGVSALVSAAAAAAGERGVDQLYNHIAELTAFGLESAEIRARRQDTNARVDIESLSRIGVIGSERARRLHRLRELRRLLVHEYATATAAQVHRGARIISSEFIPFYDAYRNWINRGFSPEPPRAF
jgi:hypothetical protein